MFNIIVSKKDSAGMNIAEELAGMKLSKNLCVTFIEEEQVFADNVNSFAGDFFVFASKHKSASGKPTLTVHPIGNWGKAELGGRDRELIPTSANMIANYLQKLNNLQQELNLPFEVSLECTHHGPFLRKPTVFIELGSTEKQWKNKEGAKAIAKTIVSETSTKGKRKTAIGLGGTHYCQGFTKLILRKNYAFSHICPEYALGNFDAEMLQKAIDATIEKVELIVLDWKGLGKEKQRIVKILEEKEILFEKTKTLLK